MAALVFKTSGRGDEPRRWVRHPSALGWIVCATGHGSLARATIESFRAYLEQHKDELTALQLLYSQPYQQHRLTFQQVRELAERLQPPPLNLTTETLWRAYAQL